MEAGLGETMNPYEQALPVNSIPVWVGVCLIAMERYVSIASHSWLQRCCSKFISYCPTLITTVQTLSFKPLSALRVCFYVSFHSCIR